MNTRQSFPTRAAQYVRMSTEHQQYSTENQSDRIALYAKERGLEIVRTYIDAGKSGLTLHRRAGLQALLSDVIRGHADFDVILIYDVSRWGRFQNTDESAHYEYLCWEAGKRIEYCAEHFENDGSPISALLKGMKRVMAAEYSRELSEKVFVGMCRITRLGFKATGNAGFGLRRALISETGERKGLMRDGERKAIHTDRIILVPGPDEERRLVAQMYDWFVKERRTVRAIATRLNAMKCEHRPGMPWTFSTVRQVLTNEKYIGNSVYGRTTTRLSAARGRTPRETWVRKEAAFEPIIDRSTFELAQTIMANNPWKKTDEEIAAQLRSILTTHGRLSGHLINSTPGAMCAHALVKRFGSLHAVYELVGFRPQPHHQRLTLAHFARNHVRRLVDRVVADLKAAGQQVSRGGKSWIRIRGDRHVYFSTIGRLDSEARKCWRLDIHLRSDITVIVRPVQPGQTEDYFVLHRSDFPGRRIQEKDPDRAPKFSRCRHDNLDFIFDL